MNILKMLFERRELLERDISSMTASCGKMYLKIVTGDSTVSTHEEYTAMAEKLSSLSTELLIVTKLISEQTA